jgi:hypothetical protein
MQPHDPHFPNLPPVADQEYARTKDQRWKRHVLEIAEAAKMFEAMQAVGMDIFDAAERVPVPRMNRTGARQSELRNLYRPQRNGGAR